jgi:serine protease
MYFFYSFVSRSELDIWYIDCLLYSRNVSHGEVNIMRKLLIGLILMLFVTQSLAALIPRAVFPKPTDPEIRSCERWDLLVVKFIEGSDVRLRNGHFVANDRVDLSPVEQILNLYPETRVARMFQRPEEEYQIEREVGQLNTGRQLADLNLYYAFGPRSLMEARNLLRDLNTLDIVECVYPEPIPEVASLMVPDILLPPDYVDSQDYLEDSPIGVDAYDGWTYPGGKGENVQMIDVELGWNWDHYDLPDPFFTGGTPSSDVGYINHGTAVLGEIRGTENTFGVTGISPLVPVGGVAININDWPESCGSWFDMASSALNPGDVWLIELHAPGPGSDYVCMEWWQGNYDAIANSTALGRICVEAGGNGSADLDNAIYEGKFDRSVRDSLAVLVGAGTPYDMDPEWFTNYGSRIDANGWGSAIVTTGYGDLYSSEGDDYWYTSDFGGTSGASPMLVGVCCVAQSVYKALAGGEVLDPLTLRSAITETGAPQPEPVTQYIGPRPNLEALLQHDIFDVEGVKWNRDIYACDMSASITVRDSSASGSVNVTVQSDTEPAGETIVLPEIESGVFETDITLTSDPPQSGDGMLSIVHDDAISAVYTPMADTDDAVMDCAGPVISDITVSGVDTTTARVTWTTDEPSTSIVRYGTETPIQTVENTDLATDHELVIEDLEECTTYFFEVESEDEAGNTTIDDNGGVFHTFTTWEEISIYQEMMDSDPGWQVSGGTWAFGQPAGLGGEHGSPDPTAGYSGTNVYGYNLNGDYGNNIPEHHLTTDALDLTDYTGVSLRFQRWLGVEQPSYDHAYVRVSNDGSQWFDVWQNSAEVADSSWIAMEYDISQWADNQATVYLRWTMGVTDTAWTYCGWNIDDVEVFVLQPCGSGTPTPFPTHTPVPPTGTPVPPTPTVPTGVPTNTAVPPTNTPIPPTETPVPPTDTPMPFTNTPIPTNTTVPPTDTPVPPTDTPIPPTDTPIPPTDTPIPPTATPDCEELGVMLTMPSHEFTAGSTCWLKVSVCSPGAPLDNVPLFVILDVYGTYWFAPGWVIMDQGIDYYSMTIPAGLHEFNAIESFTWPSGTGSADGLFFHAAMTDPGISELYGNMSTWEFAYR